MSERDKPVELTLDQCIKCNICTAACPVSAVSDLFPGPKYCGPQAARFRHPGLAVPADSVDYCSGCRVCNMVCPSGVRIAEMNARARAAVVEHGHVPIRQRIRNNLLARPELLGRLASPVGTLANRLARARIGRRFAEMALDIHRDAPIPRFAAERFTSWFASRPAPVTGASTEKQVVYFHGCSTEYYEPRVGQAAVRILEANGFEVIVPRQNCCGLPLLSNGEFAAARRYHRRNVANLVDFARKGIPIVGTSTSCTLTLKEEAPELLDLHDEATRLVAEGTYDWNEFLLLLIEQRRLQLNPRPVPLELLYHVPCQYRAHRLGAPGVELLRIVPELRIVESRADCCGIAGTYGYKKEKYDIAMRVGQPLFDTVTRSDSQVVLCDSETCRWQITHATGRRAIHPVELLAFACGLSETL